MTFGLSIKLSTPERIVVLALLATALLSTFSGWLFQVYTDTVCHQKLLLTFLLSTLFWTALVLRAHRYGKFIEVNRGRMFKDIVKAGGTGIALVTANQALIIFSVGLLFKLAYNCEVLGGWSEELFVNNVTANFFSFGLIFALVQWNAYQRKRPATKADASLAKNSFADPLWIKDYNEQTRLAMADIIWIKADNNCIHLHTTQRRFVIYRSLKSIESELDPVCFVRIHRSTIVNKHHIQKLRAFPSGDGELILANGEQLRYSRTFKAVISSVFSSHD